MKESLISYGAITEDFVAIAKYKKYLEKIKNGSIKQHRVDCYETRYILEVAHKFVALGIEVPKNVEIFWPSDNYPPHKDQGGLSYFIPLESGEFYIDNVSYPIVPFVLYAFDDGKLHNTNFAAIMLK